MQYRDKKWLFTEYVNKKKSVRDIAKQCGVSVSVIDRWLRRNEIPTRTAEEARRIKEAKVKREVAEASYMNKEWLYKRYVIEERTMQEIADGCRVSKQTIIKYMKRNGITARSRHEHFHETKRGQERFERMHRDYIRKNPQPIQIAEGRIKNWQIKGEKEAWQNQYSQNEGQLQ